MLIRALIAAGSLLCSHSYTAAQTNPKAGIPPEVELRLKEIEGRINNIVRRMPYSSATLNCDTKRYAEFVLEGSAIVLFASCVKIEPYLEGHQVTVDIGNPTSFNLSGISGTLQYGKDLLDAFTRSVPVSTTDTIRSGSWTRVLVTVNPSKPELMRHFEFSLSAQTVAPTR